MNRKHEPTAEMLEAQAVVALPERRALSLVNANLAAPINAAVALNVLSNGARSPAQIADELSAGLPWRLTADQVRWLILTKLAPAGVVEEAAPDGAAPAARRAAAPSPLAVTLRLAVVGPDLIDPLARVLQ